MQAENNSERKMKKTIFTIIAMCLSLTFVIAQEDVEISWQQREAKVREMFSEIDEMTDNDQITRMADSIQREMIEILMYEDFPFDYEFDLLPNVGCVVSDDGLLYMYSWNVPLKDQNNTSQFYALCFNKSFGVTYVLAQGIPYVPAEKGNIEESAWYGAMYYKISPVQFKDNTVYLLLGYAPIDDNRQYKIIDVMTVKKNGIRFGANMFQKADGKKFSRIVFQYARNVQMSLEYNLKKRRIDYDNLSPMGTDENGNTLYGPDMSVSCFKFKKGMFVQQDNVDARNSKKKK